MRFMLRSLQILLTAAAALATVLVGLRESLSGGPPVGIAIRSVDNVGHDGSREDDSGTLTEQSQEDDTEEQEGREIHLLSSIPPRGDVISPLHVASLEAPCRAVDQRSSATRVRGPPRTR